eukprot:c3075_g1_i1.p1 GENE.c3075_g1_i1~~c3075_g1_i1.p1  ORF type:complete len:211 (-),score=32.23 c3075_g1_i1:66-698(-)
MGAIDLLERSFSMATRIVSAQTLARAKQAGTLFAVGSNTLQDMLKPELNLNNTLDRRIYDNLPSFWENSQKAGFPLFPHMSLGTGLWRASLSKNMNELRFLCCPVSSSSATLRDFIVKEHADLKYHNPLLPMLVREADYIEPKIVARYDYGQEMVVPVEGFSTRMLWETLYLLNLRGETQLERSAESYPFKDFVVNRPEFTFKIGNLPVD